MNKVLAALDELKLSESTVDYSIYLSEELDAHIVAAFLEDITYHAGSTEQQEAAFTNWSRMDILLESEKPVRVASQKKLQSKFDAQGIHYNIHHNRLLALEALLHESYYADLLLIDSNENFSNWDASKPSHFLKNVLADSQCPIMIVPAAFKPIEKIVFAYDGSPSSIYAIKQFSYLFSFQKDITVEILMVTDDEHSNHFPDQHLLKELLKRKYKVVLQSVIKNSNTTRAFVTHIKAQEKNCMLVLGAYQRSAFSRWLYQSLADTLISELDIPLFIAHK